MKEKILETKVINKDYYTAESFAALQTAVKAARKAVDTVITQEELDAALDALQEAVDALERLPLNHQALSEKIAEAKAIQQGNYTDESYAALQTAIQSAEEAMEAVETEEALQAVIEALQGAIDRLQEKDPGTSGGPGNSGGPGDSENSGKPEEPQKSQPLQAVSSVKAVQQATGKAVKVSYGKVSGAESYDIYRSTKPNSGYAKIGNAKSNSYVDKKVNAAKTYYYKVLAVAKTAECNSALSERYAKVKVLASPKAKVKSSKGRKITVSWKKVKGAKGYIVYTSAKKNKGFKAAKTLKKATAVKAVIKAKKNVKTLYVRVRPYYTENGKKVIGSYSKTIRTKVKK